MTTAVATKVAFAAEPLSADLWAEAMPLLVAHWAEVAHFKDIPLEPDLAVYRQADVNGAVRVFTARKPPADATRCQQTDTPGLCWNCKPGPCKKYGSRLVGYALFFVRANPHYASSVQAVQDVLYIAPECRGITSYRFIRWCDEQLKAAGVEAVYQHSKAAHDFGGLLEHQGYERVDIIYAKRLN